MRFDINLASQPYQDVQRFLTRWALGLFAAGIVTIVLLYAAATSYMSWRVTEQQINKLRADIAKDDQQKSQVQALLARPENRETRDRSQFLNGLLARKAFSWTEVFADLEHLMPPRLLVTTIHPEVNDNGQLELHLAVIGSSRDSAIELVRRLETSPHFMNAQIRAERTQGSGPGKGEQVGFEVTAIYVPTFARPQKQAAAGAGEAAKQTSQRETEASNARH